MSLYNINVEYLDGRVDQYKSHTHDVSWVGEQYLIYTSQETHAKPDVFIPFHSVRKITVEEVPN